MRTLGLLLMFAVCSVAYAEEPANGCITCHLALADSTLSAPARKIGTDVHTQWHITCTDCHGGDGTATTKAAAKAPSAGYLGKPSPRDIPDRCGSCHSDPVRMYRANPSIRIDQAALYRTSVHGQRLATGDTKVATCVSCHGVHGILPVNDPRSPVFVRNVVPTCMKCHADPSHMAGYTITDRETGAEVPLPTDQGEKYLASVHGRALYKKGDASAPTCTSCHGNHGAAPPGVSDVSAVCRQCHVTQADVFDASPHKELFHDAGLPECTSCHGNHRIAEPSDRMVGDTETAVCAKCHSEGDDQLVVALGIRTMLDSLSLEIGAADSTLRLAEISGMDIEEGAMVLRSAKDGLIRSRNFVHGVQTDLVEEIYGPAMVRAKEAARIGRSLLRETTVRRVGLAVSLVLIVALAVALVFKIREIDQRSPPE